MQQQVSLRYQTELNLFMSKFLDKGTYKPQKDTDTVNIKMQKINKYMIRKKCRGQQIQVYLKTNSFT